MGHLKRNLYGNVQAGRVWEQYICHWIIKNVEGARFYINDHNAFEWSFEGETLRGVVHAVCGVWVQDTRCFRQQVGSGFQSNGRR